MSAGRKAPGPPAKAKEIGLVDELVATVEELRRRQGLDKGGASWPTQRGAAVGQEG